MALAQTDFSSSLGVALREYAPGVNETLINSVGATGVRGAVTAEQLPGVLRAYNQAVRNTFVSLDQFSLDRALFLVELLIFGSIWVLLHLRSHFVQPGAWVSRVSGRISGLDRATLKSFDGIRKGYSMGEMFNIRTLHLYLYRYRLKTTCVRCLFMLSFGWVGTDELGRAKLRIVYYASCF